MSGPFATSSAKAAAIASLFTNALWMCAAIFTIVTVLVVTCIVRFRARGNAEPKQVEGNLILEIGWTLGPIVILAWLLFLTVRTMSASDPPVDRDPDLTIVGHQWWWEVKYASGAITANEIHIPTGKSLVVRLESADVIHDFWVPALGRKLDAIPGRPGSFWIEANAAGVYEGACAEYCGVQHAWMRIKVVAESPESFRAWNDHQLTPAPPAQGMSANGAALFQNMTCANCHAVRGGAGDARVGPDLTHLAERSTLGAGVLANTPTELTRWLKDPQSIKEGCHMPSTQLTDAQAADLVAYLETLQ